MELRLYKESYRETADPGRVRLLFEGKAPPGANEGPMRDFYLFVWLRDSRYVENFQAVLADDLVFSYAGPHRVSIGRITDSPVKRAVQGGVSETDKRSIREALAGMHSRDFPDLVNKIAGRAAKGLNCDMQLSAAEQRLFRQLKTGTG